MFAVIKTGGKQYRVAAEDEITVMTLPGEPGDVAFAPALGEFADHQHHMDGTRRRQENILPDRNRGRGRLTER